MDLFYRNLWRDLFIENGSAYVTNYDRVWTCEECGQFLTSGMDNYAICTALWVYYA